MHERLNGLFVVPNSTLCWTLPTQCVVVTSDLERWVARRSRHDSLTREFAQAANKTRRNCFCSGLQSGFDCEVLLLERVCVRWKLLLAIDLTEHHRGRPFVTGIEGTCERVRTLSHAHIKLG